MVGNLGAGMFAREKSPIIGALVCACQPSTSLITQMVCGGPLNEGIFGVGSRLYSTMLQSAKALYLHV